MEQWHYRIKDAFVNLADFIESNKSTIPYDKLTVEFLNSVSLLKKADESDLKKAMREVVLGMSSLANVQYPNIELMKGLDSGESGFIIFDPVTEKGQSGPFMKSDWVFRFISKMTGTDGVVLPITAEIRVRFVLNNMVERYTKDPKMKKEFIDAWFYSTSCIADAFQYFINHYCLKEVNATDRDLIKNKIPKNCRDPKPLGNSIKVENIFKLARNISKNDYTKSMLGAFGVDPSMIEHLIGATQENLSKFDIETFRTQALEAAQTGDINDLGSTVKGIVATMSHCMPSIDDGDPDEQD